MGGRGSSGKSGGGAGNMSRSTGADFVHINSMKELRAAFDAEGFNFDENFTDMDSAKQLYRTVAPDGSTAYFHYERNPQGGFDFTRIPGTDRPKGYGRLKKGW